MLDLNRTAAVAVLQARDLRGLLGRYALAVFIFVVLAVPSWVPRMIVFDDPVYHGYLSNYLWVDTYEEGHINEPIYGPGDYFSSHDLGDVLDRITRGLVHVFWFWGAPGNYGVNGGTLYLIGMLGLVAAVLTRRAFIDTLLTRLRCTVNRPTRVIPPTRTQLTRLFQLLVEDRALRG